MLKQHWRPIRALWASTEAFAAMGVQIGLMTHPPHPLLGSPGTTATPIEITGIALVAGLGSMLALDYCGAYDSQRRRTIREQLRALLTANMVLGFVFSGIAFTLRLPVPPLMPAVFAGCLFTAEVALRIPIFLWLRSLRRGGLNNRNILIIGTGPRAAAAWRTIAKHPEWGLRLIGFIDHEQGDYVPAVPVDKIHKLIELPDLLREESIDEVLIACPRSMLDGLEDAVYECSLIGVPVTLLTDLFGAQLPPPRAGSFDDLGTISFAPVHHDFMALKVKRAIDIVGSIVGLILSAPILLAAAIAIKLDDGGTVFFRQWRCGLNGRRFQMVKLRTMVPEAELLKTELLHLNEMDGPVFKIKDDPRTTEVGRTLRKWSIDELPQFWNVLRGQMSLVGPRPPTPDEVGSYRGRDRRRLSMRPGLTCLWQVSGRNEIDFDEWMRLDRKYIDEWRLRRDIVILLRTLPVILLRKGAS
jgi:exopolysaccharide biosynthesis polyprenyl glycosylphosphotransferase